MLGFDTGCGSWLCEVMVLLKDQVYCLVGILLESFLLKYKLSFIVNVSLAWIKGCYFSGCLWGMTRNGLLDDWKLLIDLLDFGLVRCYMLCKSLKSIKLGSVRVVWLIFNHFLVVDFVYCVDTRRNWALSIKVTNARGRFLRGWPWSRALREVIIVALLLS